MARYKMISGVIETDEDTSTISTKLKNIALKEGNSWPARIQALEARVARLEKLLGSMRETGRAIFDDVTEVKDVVDLTQRGSKDEII